MSKLIIRDGHAFSVYSDLWAPITRALGNMECTRATDVEFDPARQEWTATYRPTGQTIARGPNRAEVIKQEVLWLEENVIR